MTRHAPTFRNVLALGTAVLTCMLIAGQPAEASAPKEQGGDLDYVALGDSYAAAPGVPDQVDTECARSSRNYPSLVAERWKARLTDVTCSGATTADLAAGQHGAQAQYAALRPDTDLVTVSIGGNDGVPFSTVLKTCAELSKSDPQGAPCRSHFTAGGSDRLLQGVAETAPKISEVINTIHRRSPKAKVLVVGYPSIFPDSGVGCTSRSAPFSAGDFAYLRDTDKALNTMLAQRARTGGAAYIDTYTPTIGHDMCRPAEDRWIENLAPETPAAPAHPNARGEAAMADAVNKALAACPPGGKNPRSRTQM